MEWTLQQSAALKAVGDWYKSTNRKQVFRVFGYAGVGKTSLAKHFAESINGNVLYAAYTGKAALMMRNNGCTDASTIHSLIYKPVEDENGNITFVLNFSSALSYASLLIIDECSMVGTDLATDILRFNVPVLVLGDPAQLPPVADTGYFTDAAPDVMLTEIHRQAKDNPIIYLATRVREGQSLISGKYGDSIISDTIDSTNELVEFDQVLVGRNATRTMLNKTIRNMIDRNTVLPTVGDRLICLKNDRNIGILNGEMFNVEEVISNKATSQFTRYKLIDIDTADKHVTCKVHNSFFDGTKHTVGKIKHTQEFDYGYAITAHKAQGSQWGNVLIFNESWCFRDEAKRWLYTAITRAQNKILMYNT